MSTDPAVAISWKSPTPPLRDELSTKQHAFRTRTESWSDSDEAASVATTEQRSLPLTPVLTPPRARTPPVSVAFDLELASDSSFEATGSRGTRPNAHKPTGGSRPSSSSSLLSSSQSSGPPTAPTSGGITPREGNPLKADARKARVRELTMRLEREPNSAKLLRKR